MKKQLSFITLLIFLLTVATAYTSGQETDYSKVFGENWKKAVAFEEQNRQWLKPLIENFNISYPQAVSIVFPELIRYSALQDKMETGILKTLYVNLGRDYSDFSIGVFQMKPSFAELILDKVKDVAENLPGIDYQVKSNFDDIIDFRKSIVQDLERPESEAKFLIAFIKICNKDFNTGAMDDTTAVRFLSAAYNYGIEKPADEIKRMSGKKYFSVSVLGGEKYCYSDISLYCYRKMLAQKP